MDPELEFPSISPDAWAHTAPMQLDDDEQPAADDVPCPWGYEMMGAACSMEHVDGRRLVGQLLQWDPARNRCLLRATPDHAEVQVPLPQLRLVTLSDVLPPGSALATGGWGVPTTRNEPQHFRIDVDGGLLLSGIALHTVRRPEGLYLARRVSEAGACVRLFMPRRAVLHAEFEGLEDTGATGAPRGDGDTAGIGMSRLEPACSAAALLQAVEMQSRQPVRRLGDILVSLGLVSSEQLSQALSAARQDDSQPLGQHIVRMGLVSPQNMQRALHLKMGYPCVDLKHFAFDRALLKALPFKLAAELDALPLARTADGSVVVALDDPGRLGQLKPLRLLFNAPLVAAMPWREPVQHMIHELYGAGDIGASGPRWYG